MFAWTLKTHGYDSNNKLLTTHNPLQNNCLFDINNNSNDLQTSINNQLHPYTSVEKNKLITYRPTLSSSIPSHPVFRLQFRTKNGKVNHKPIRINKKLDLSMHNLPSYTLRACVLYKSDNGSGNSVTALQYVNTIKDGSYWMINIKQPIFHPRNQLHL